MNFKIPGSGKDLSPVRRLHGLTKGLIRVSVFMVKNQRNSYLSNAISKFEIQTVLNGNRLSPSAYIV